MLVNREKSSNFLERRTNVNEHPVNDSHGIRIGISSHHWKTPANQIRAFLLERGMVFAQRPAKLKAVMAGVLENADADLTPRMRSLIDMLWSEWKLVEEQIKDLDLELERISASDAGCTRIPQIPGIGPVTATAIVAAIGNGAAFRKGRDFAAWLGIVPRQYSTGGKAKLLGISKRGNVYLRKLNFDDSGLGRHGDVAYAGPAGSESCP